MEIILSPTGLFLLLFGILVHLKPGNCVVTNVEWIDSDPARIGTTARLVCLFEVQFPFTFQYAEFTKILPDGTRDNTLGERIYVYELNRCSNIDRGYNDLEGRASAVLVEPDPTVVNTPAPGQAGLTPAPTGLPGVTSSPRRAHISDGTIAVYDPERQAMVYTSDRSSAASQPTVAGEGVVTLLIQNVTFTDAATYECAVKGVGGPRVTDLWELQVVVLPSQPVLTLLSPPAVEDRNVTLECLTNLGRPRGEISWSRRALLGGDFVTIDDDQVMTRATANENGTTSVVSTHSFIGRDGDNDAVYRCEVTSNNLRPWEASPYAELTVNLLYPPKNGRILFDAQVGRYLCVAEGNPQPEFMWLWVVGDEDRRIVSTDRYLDLSVIEESGLFTFRCVASNVIDDVRNTRIMDTEIRVLGNPGGTRPPYLPNGHPGYGHAQSHPSDMNTASPHQGYNHRLHGDLNIPLDVKITDKEVIPIYRPQDLLHGYNQIDNGYAATQDTVDDRLNMETEAPATTTPPATTTAPPTTTATIQPRSNNNQRNNNARNARAGGFGGGGGAVDYDDYEEITIIRPRRYKHRNRYGKELDDDSIGGNVADEPLERNKEEAEGEEGDIPVWLGQEPDALITDTSADQPSSHNPTNHFAELLARLKPTWESTATGNVVSGLTLNRHDKIDDRSIEDEYKQLEHEKLPTRHEVKKFADVKRADASQKEISDFQDAFNEYDIDPDAYYNTNKKQQPEQAEREGRKQGPQVREQPDRAFRKRRPQQRRQRKKVVQQTRSEPRRRKAETPRRPSRGKTGLTAARSEPIANSLGGSSRVSPFDTSLLSRRSAKSGVGKGVRSQSQPLRSQLNALQSLQKNKAHSTNRPLYRPVSKYDFIDKPYQQHAASFRNKYAKMAGDGDYSANEISEYSLEEPDPFFELERQHVVETINEQYEPLTHRVVSQVASETPRAVDRMLEPVAPLPLPPPADDGPVNRPARRPKNIPGSYEHEDAVLASHDEHDCRERADGPYGGGCLAFYRCTAGKTYYVECHEGFVFNRRAGQCDEAKSAPMPCGKWIDCAGKPSGKYANFDADCKSYYTCMSGVYFGSTDCPTATAYDEQKGVCDWLENVAPPCGTGGIIDRPRGRFAG